MSNAPNDWTQWLANFRQRFIEAHRWDERVAKLRLRDGFVCVRDGHVQTLVRNDNLPAGTLPVFFVLTPGGWKLPIQIHEHLTGLVSKAMSSQRPPRDIVLGLLSNVEHAGRPDEDDETREKRQKAAFWVCQLLDACEDKALAGVIGSDVFWQAILSALEAGRWYTILELYQDPQLIADQIKAQAFQSGRPQDKLSRRLEQRYLEMCDARGRSPKPHEVAEAAGGIWSEIDDCWQFDDLDGLPSLTQGALYDRLDKIRRKHS
jgi:hypothetical protein